MVSKKNKKAGRISYIFFHTLLLLWGFFLLQFGYAQVHKFFFVLQGRDFWVILQERLLYGLVFVVGGAFLFFSVFPRFLFPKSLQNASSLPSAGLDSNSKYYLVNIFRNNLCEVLFKKKEINQKALPSSLRDSLWLGLAGGVFLFAVLMFWQWAFLGEKASGNVFPKQEVYKQQVYLGNLWIHFFSSVFLTPIFEEIFYRAYLIGYMERVWSASQRLYQTSPSSKAYPKAHSDEVIEKVVYTFLIFFPALLFAVVHPKAPVFMLAAGGLFTFLYWKRGLVASVFGHAIYNALILFATAYQIKI